MVIKWLSPIKVIEESHDRTVERREFIFPHKIKLCDWTLSNLNSDGGGVYFTNKSIITQIYTLNYICWSTELCFFETVLVNTNTLCPQNVLIAQNKQSNLFFLVPHPLEGGGLGGSQAPFPNLTLLMPPAQKQNSKNKMNKTKQERIDCIYVFVISHHYP